MKKVNLINWRTTFAWQSPLIFLIAICCGFTLVSTQVNAQATITCPASFNLGNFACGADVPAAPTDEASVTAPPYNVVISGVQGTIVVTSDDFPAAPDACGGASVTRTLTIFDDLDGNGMADPAEVAVTCPFIYMLEADTDAPVFDAPPAAIADITCSDPLPVQETLTATDNCTDPVIVMPDVDPFVVDICAGYAVTYRWTAEDDCGNEAVETVTFNVLSDTEAPAFVETLPVDLNLMCSDAIPVAATLTATDNCDAAPSVGFEEAMAGACPDPTVITRTWTAEDACGQTTVHVQTITIAPDTEAPVLSAMPADAALTCADAIPPAEMVTATDNCTDPINVVLEEVDDMGVCPAPRIITRTWTATDECDNVATHTQTITVAPDTEVPAFVEALPADEALTCADMIPAAATLTATDNCIDPITVIFTEDDDALTCPDTRTITRTWTATDDCTNEVAHIQVITIAPDVTPPVFVEALPADEALTCADMIPTAAVLTATDDCTDPVNVVFSEVDDALACPDTRTITRTWTATDECDNEVEHIQVITIAPDVTPPAFVEALPADEALTCADMIPAAAVLTATDDCTDPVNVVFNEVDDALTCPDTRTITRTWVATDDCGNEVDHTQVITIGPDVMPPTFVEALPVDVALTCADAIPAAAVLTATDDCTDPVDVVFNEVDDALTCPDARTIIRTWVATDDCGNEVEHIQTITIAPDVTPPAFVEALPADEALTCADAIPAAALLTATDDCTAPVTVIFTEVDDALTCPDARTITRTWMAADDCGNMVDHTQVITIAPDTEVPAFVEVLPVDVALVCSDAIPVADVLTATDNCSVIIVVFDEVDDALTCPDARTIVRTWTATDDCGNEVEHIQTITIAPDTEAPVLSEMPSDVALGCGDPTPVVPMITATDDCTDPVDVVFAETEMGDCPVDRIIERTWTATDACGNEVSHTQTITIAPDTEMPVLSAMPADVVLACGDPIPDPEMITATDNCTDPVDVVFAEMASGDCPIDRVIERTWTATDACGNMASYTQTITIAPDTEDPVLSDMPADITLACSDAIPAADVLTATDDCTTPIDVVFDEVDDMGVCPDPRIITRTWTATDACGNEATHTQIVTVEPDTEAPVLSEMPADLVLTCVDAIPDAPMVTATDNCAVIIDFVFNDDDDDLLCPDDRTITRTWTATDECGNEVTHTQTITILPDTDAPVLSALPADIALTCADAIPPAETLTATDICDTDVIVLVNEVNDGGVCPDPTIITRTYSATDDCGNEAIHVQTITIAPDTELPVLSAMPADVILACSDAIPPADVITATDNCTDPINVVFTEVSDNGVCPAATIITRTWTATDACGNEAQHIQTITIEPDTELPVLSAMPADITLACSDAIPPADVITATDNCTDPINVVFTEVSDNGVCPAATIITRTWTATDDCGNEAMHVQTITIEPDTELPVLSAMPMDMILACGDAIPPAEVVTATDNCTDPINVVFNETDNNEICVTNRIITRTWTATDDCGNEATHTQTITFEPDADAPVLSAMPASIDLTCADAIPPAEAITATDNCTDPINVVFNEDDDNGVCPMARVITRTWTATDDCGNETQHIQTITIAPDTEVPVLSAMPADLNLTCTDLIPPAEAVTATDNCTDPITVIFVENDDNASICPADGRTITRTWTATDDCGNETTHTQTINILDDTPPTIDVCPPSEVDLICSFRVPLPDVSLVQATDECGTVAITWEGDDDPVAISCPGNPRVVTRTYRATDECGNFTDCVQTFTYAIDDVPPVVKVPEGVTLTCDQDLPTFAESLALVEYADENDCTLQADLVVDISDDFPMPTSFCESDPRVVTRTYTVTDLCGNTTVRTQTFTYEADVTPPTITACPNAAPVILQCGDPLPPVDISIIEATDNCTADDDILVIAQDDINPATTISCDGSPISVIRTYTVIDNCGNEATCQQTFTYAPDTEAPTITVCPLDVVDLQCGDAIPAIDTRLVIAEDNCIPMESIMIEGADDLDPATFSFCAADANGLNANGDPAFIVTRTYTAMDKCGNESTCTQQFIFDVDTEGPSFTCPLGEFNLAPETPLPPVDTMAIIASATDNCNGDVTVSHDNPPLPADYCPGSNLTVIRTITVTDACGNISTCEQTFTYTEEDNPPTITCPTDITVCTDAGVCEAAVTWPDPMPMDDCPGLQVISTHNSGDIFPIGNTAVSYTLIDAAGNVTGCKFIVTVEDCEAPIITCPISPIIVSNDAGQCTATVVIDPPAAATDNCINVNVTNDIPSANVFPVGTTTVTYTATDDAGNTATCAIDVIVNDTELPTVTCPADIMVSATTGQCDAPVTWTAPTPADNCAGVTIAGSHAPGDVFPVGTTTVTYTVTDAAGNVTTCDFNITVTDDEAPVFNCINGIGNNVELTTEPGICGATATWAPPVATDNCDVTVTTSFPPGTIFPVGATAVTYTATDPSGNMAVCKFVVIVTDEEFPTITCPADITDVSAEDGLCSAVVTWVEPIFDDNCPGACIKSTHNSGDAFPVGTTTVTYTVADFAGNETTCSFDITVEDNEAPVIFCPGDILITTAPGQCEAVLTWIQPIPTDNCDTDLTTAVTHKPGTSFPIGTTTVIYTVTDDAGNQATCSFDVTVVDDEAPAMTCPTDITVSADAGTCEATVSWAVPIVSDNCPGGVTLTSTHNPGDVFSVGTTTVTYTATDANGRITICSFVVTVNDDEAPPLTCPADITVSTTPGSCDAVVMWTAPEPVMGDCLGVGITVTSNFNPGDTFPLGTTSVIYSAVDGAGNQALCSFNVTVEDNEPPSVVECPSDILMTAEPGMCSAIVEWTPPVPEPMDNCPGVVVVSGTHDSGDSFPLGTTMVTYTIQDASGNIVTCSFTVTITDDEDPTIACPANISVTNDVGECGAVVNWTPPVPQDNCPGAMIITSSHNPGDFFPVGTTKVVYTMEDATGAVAECSFFVEVVDNNPVLLQCPADMTVDTDGGECTATVFWDAPLYIDNCDETNLSSNHEPGDVFPLGCTTVEYFVTQMIGGALQVIETCDFEVCVEDNEAPTFDCPANILVSTDPGTCTAFVDWVIPVPSDNCPGAVVSGFSHTPGQAFPIGTTTVIYTIDDANGNSELCIFTITVEDNSILAITCPSDINVSTANCETAVSWAVPSATGNCVGALTTNSTHNPGDIFSIGCTTVTYTVSDVDNNTVTCSFDVCVEDTAGPTLTCPADITVSAVSQDNICGATVGVPVPQFGVDYNDCTGATIINSMNGTNDATAFYPVGTTPVTWTVTDDDGNVTTCEQRITVIDNTTLIVACPDDITVTTVPGSCEAIVAWNEPDASDNCTEVNSIISTHNSGDSFPVGCTTVTYTVLGGGGAATCSFDVCVEECAAGFNDITESIAPLISDQDVFAGATDQQSFAANGVYTFIDPSTPASATLSNINLDLFFRVEGASCESDIEIQLTDPSGAVVFTGAPFTTCNGSGTHPAGDLYSTTITIPSATTTGNATNWILQFRDTNDQNTGAVEYSVRFGRINYDYTISVPIPGGCADPVIVNCPADISISATNSCGANLTIPAPVFGVDFTDCTNATITNSYTGTSSGSGFYPAGTTIVTWTVTDAAGNTVSCEQTITIVDDVAPSINCPADITVTTSAGNCDGIVTWNTPNTSDNCGVASVTSTHTSGTAFPAGTTTVTYTVTDDNGNTATCSFDVTVEELAGLSMVCPSDISVTTQPGQCAAAVTWSVPTVNSPCVNASITNNSHAPGMEFPLGCTTVTYTATDDLGNTADCSFEVCVDECSGGGTPTTTSTTETITLIDDADAFIGFNDQESFASNTTYTFNDPATPANAVISNATLQLFFRVEYASCESDIEIRVSDPAGNVVTTTTLFTTCNGSGANPYPGQLYNTTIPLPGGAGMTTGALDNWVIEFRDTNDQNAGVNEYSVRFGRLIYDATITTTVGGGAGCGIPLIVNCPADVTTSATANCAAAVSIPVPMYGVDFLDCAGATIANSYTGTADASGTYPMGTTVVIWTVTDTDGNIVTCEQTITVTDDVAPTLTCPANITVSTAPGQCDATVTWAEPTLADNCGATMNGRSHNSGDSFPIGCTTITYEAADNAGNTAMCSFEVCVDECNGGGTPGSSTTETVTLISDSDEFIGAADAQSFASNGTYLFTDPGTAANAVISNATLQLFFRVENASCESDIEIQLTDPAGNVVYTGGLFTTCNGSGTHPAGQLYSTTIPITGGATTGSTANWVLEFRDTNDQNAGAVEYSVRFGRLIYDATVTTPGGGAGCGLPAIVNCPADVTVNANTNCEANITVPVPVFGVDYLDCAGATMTNDFTGTSNASAVYPAGTTVLTWTVIDTDGNVVTCEQTITVLENGCDEEEEGEFTSCPNDIALTTTPGTCGAIATWTGPAISGGTLSSTHNPGEEFPVGCTTVTYTIVGTNTTCSFDVCVNECVGADGETTTETITLIDDADAFIGFNDMESFSSNTTYTFNDPATPANAVLSNITLQLFFRVEYASCESDIEIRVSDPAGNVVYTGPMFSTCNGSGANPYPGQLYQNTISLPGGTAMTTGNLNDWVVEFRDINDQNAGVNEYSVRFGRIIYDATVTTPGMGGCADPVIVNCPADIIADAADGECEAAVSVPVPQFGADFTDCTSATIANDYTGTANASATYPAGTTMVTWTVTDADGNTATCTQNITVNPGFIASDAVELISDSDLLIGGADTESFADNGVYLFTDPATPANAALSNIDLLLFFRVENASCESDIEIQVTDPAGNVVYVGSPFTTCNGSGANPFPGQLYNTTISIPSASTTGSLANWTVEFRDTDDQNAGATEYSVRFGRINYDVGGMLDCDPMVINQGATPSVNSLMVEESELGHDIKLYPVPTMGRLTLEYTADEDEQIQVDLFNVNGQALRSIEQQVFKGVNTIDLAVYELPGGMYYVRTIDNLGTTKVKPFTKLAP